MSTICTNCRNNPCVMSCEEKTKCPDYDEGKPIAYNHARAEQIIKQLESELKLEKALWKTLAKQNDELQEEIDRVKAENEKLKEENVDLRFEAVKAFERGQKFPCNLDCDKCIEKCRAWQRGFDTTCERECNNCEVITDMQSLKNVLSKLMFDYAEDLRGDTE